MWHIQREEFKRLKSGSSALNILYQEGCTYVMDNHLAAGWCWYNTLDRRKEYNFCQEESYKPTPYQDQTCNTKPSFKKQ